MLCFCAADVVYALRITHGSYVIGTPLDALWSVGMTMMALALWRPLQHERRRTRLDRGARPSRWSRPLAAVGVLLWATAGRCRR